MSWTVTNAGQSDTAVSSWTDQVILRSTTGNSPDIVLGSFQHTGALASGGSYTQNVNVILPAQLSGDYSIGVVVDSGLAVLEPDTRFDNTRVSPITISTAAADLAVDSIFVPGAARTGDTVDFSWTVHNTGDGPTDASNWTDRVVLSTGTMIDDTSIVLADVAHAGALQAGSSYTQHLSITIPNSVVGTFNVFVITDNGRQVFENGRTANNTAKATTPIKIISSVAPDLTVTNVTAPASGVPGQQQTVTWTVSNAGGGTARAIWSDTIYYAPESDSLKNAVVLGSVQHRFDLAYGESYTETATITLPLGIDGSRRIVVVTDSSHQIYEAGQESNNSGDAAFTYQHPDLIPSAVSLLNSNLNSGDAAVLSWTVNNTGSGPALGSWVDSVYLSRDDALGQDDIKLASFAHDGPLAAGASYSLQKSVALPLGAAGSYKLLVVADQATAVAELGDGELNNLASTDVQVSLSPYADLAVSGVTAPSRAIDNPASINVTWTVTNNGTGVGRTGTWTDAVIASIDDIVGDGDDIVLGTVQHSGGLQVGQSYSVDQRVFFGSNFSARVHLFVTTDYGNAVFENGNESNNLSELDHPLDVMPEPYADLVVSSISSSATAESGSKLNLTWTVTNQGIGITDTNAWQDSVTLVDSTGKETLLALPTHFGAVANGSSYTTTAEITLPNGISGIYHIKVVAADDRGPQPFEFIYSNNNTRLSDAIDIALAPSPNLVVSQIAVPANAVESDYIDVSWTVTNTGSVAADRRWQDSVVLQPVGRPELSNISVGTFVFEGSLASGANYTRTERFLLPAKIEGLYRAAVLTNSDRGLYEYGAAALDNATGDDALLSISLKPRPDLQVSSAIVPAHVPAGGTASLQFTVVNQGTVPATGHWNDAVYLSLDGTLSSDDVLLGKFANGAALDPGEPYTTLTPAVNIPIRFRGDAYFIVVTDADNTVDEHPNDNNNTSAFRFTVDPKPFADLVTSAVVAPTQAVAGSQVEIRYTVTNRGSATTNTETWHDTIWLTRDATRPAPGSGAILLGTFDHNGALDINEGYDRVVTLTLPDNLASGQYYITPWSDSFDAVLEDSLATNINPDDPHEIDNNNYKARPIGIIGVEAAPVKSDYAVTSVSAPTQAVAGGLYTATWTVGNLGPGDTPGSWTETVYLADQPTFGSNTRVWQLDSISHDSGLAVGQVQTTTKTYDLGPSSGSGARYFLVAVNHAGIDAVPANNIKAVASEILTRPSDLRVTQVQVPPQNFSGELTTIEYQVTNFGDAVWSGTQYWTDSVYFSRNPTFNLQDVTLLGSFIHGNAGGLGNRASYTGSVQGHLPPGIEGDYFIYVMTDSGQYTNQAERESDFAFYPDGLAQSRELYSHSVFEGLPDQSNQNASNLNNIARADLPVTYREPDLQVTALTVPQQAPHSGDTITVGWTVSNLGTRATRQGAWVDNIFLSRDPTLGPDDFLIGSFAHTGALGFGASYDEQRQMRLPDEIDGSFYVIIETDAQFGKSFQTPLPVQGIDRISDQVAEFQGEGNNAKSAPLSVIAQPAPDLVVTQVTSPEHVTVGQPINFSFTVANLGGATLPTQGNWTDAVYLSRDPHLDILSDRYIGSLSHAGGLPANGSYTINGSLRAPGDLTGAYYLFVVSDPMSGSRSAVYESANERNNALSSAQPILLELPPPSDLVVDSVTAPAAGNIGDPVQITWTVRNQADSPAQGTWSDAVYLSTDSVWDVNDVLLGRQSFSGTLNKDGTYTLSLTAAIPPVKDGQYRLIVRSDIFKDVYEGPPNSAEERNNATASLGALTVSVDEIQLDVPFAATLSTGESRVYRVTVPEGETLKVRLIGSSQSASNELFVRYGDVPSGFQFDAIYQDQLQADQIAVIPQTKAGEYYILVRGNSEPSDHTPITVLAQVAPFAITKVVSDQGGDSRWVTLDVYGTRFAPNAILKLVRPDIAEFEPATYQVLDSTHIRATFDFTGAPHGLYDVVVINPDGNVAIEAYRYLIERAVEPDATIGLGGPRVVLAGDTNDYSIAFQSLSNLDTPYVYFTYGATYLGTNNVIYDLPYVTFATNLGGQPDISNGTNIPWASLSSAVNLNGRNLAPGYLYNLQAGGFNGLSFDLATYPGLRALNDRAWEQFKQDVYANIPALQGQLEDGPASLDALSPGLADLYASAAAVPSERVASTFTPFKFNVVAAATSLTRDEFIARQRTDAEALRLKVLADPTANPALQALAADKDAWGNGFLAALEDAGILQPSDQAPPIHSQQQVQSLVSVLATGILYGPAGAQVAGTGDLVTFFGNIRSWYGDTPDAIAPISYYDHREDIDLGLSLDVPVPALASYADYNLGLSHQTYFQNVNVYTAWVPFAQRGAGLVIPDPASSSASSALSPLDFSELLRKAAGDGQLAVISGPQGYGATNLVPAATDLPYSISFENPSTSSTRPGEIQIVTKLDSDLDPRSFRLGDLTIGDITVHVPSDRAIFQGDFDFTKSKGFILRVSAGVDVSQSQATWLLQAIDPTTGEVIQDPSIGLLAPDNAQGIGIGKVGYIIQPKADLPSGTEIAAQARVAFNTMAPQDTAKNISTLDASAPVSMLTAQLVDGTTATYDVRWSAQDEAGGSGVAHVTVYVASDGGDFKIWQRQSTASSAVYQGEAGHTYEFLALATDNAGNQEKPTFGVKAPGDGSQVNLGSTTIGDTTPQDLQDPPAPTPSSNPLFIAAKAAIPAAQPLAHLPEFTTTIAPFGADSFATGIGTSEAGIGSLAFVVTPDGGIIASGGANRGSLYRFGHDGGAAGTPLITLDVPIFDLAFDQSGQLWATTGGGALLLLDATTGAIKASFGDGLTQALAIDPINGQIYVSSADGVEIFDPVSHSFRHFSDTRVDDLAFSPTGELWGTSWPERGDVVSFDGHGRAHRQLSFDSKVDSIAFGQAGTQLAGILFISNNLDPASNAGSSLIAVDTATLDRVMIATGGTRGETVQTTADGRLLIAQSHQIDVVAPITAPHVVAVNPPDGSSVALPFTKITVRFDRDMLQGDPAASGSVLNPVNYSITSSSGDIVLLNGVSYDVASRTATLIFDPVGAASYTLVLDSHLTSVQNVQLGEPFTSSFSTIADLSAQLDITFTNVRSQRSDGSISYDVSIKNIGADTIVAPITLLVDPASFLQQTTEFHGTQTSSGVWLIQLSNLVGGVLRPGETTVAQTVSVQNTLFQHLLIGHSVLALPASNTAPVFTSESPAIIDAGELFEYQATAEDADGNAVSFVLLDGPDGMTVDPQTGLVTWQSSAQSPKNVSGTLAVFDSRGAASAQSFDVLVVGGNRAPDVDDLPDQILTPEGQPFSVGLQVTDLDGGHLVYFADRLPPGALLDPVSHLLTWTPGAASAGTYQNVVLGVFDGVNRVTRSFDLIVTPVDQAPTLVPVSDRIVREGDPVRIQLRASDPENSDLTFSSPQLPTGAVLDPNTGVFEWTPEYTAVGSYHVTFMVSDSNNVTQSVANFTVLNANGAPVFDTLGPFQSFENQPISFRAFAFDPDNPGFVPQDRIGGVLNALDGTAPTVSYQVEGLPTGATFDPITAVFAWTPGYEQSGTYVVRFIATDTGDGLAPATSIVDVPINILNANRAPVISAIANQTVGCGGTLEIPFTFADADADALTLDVTVSRLASAGSGAVDTTPVALGATSALATFTITSPGQGLIRFTPGDGDRGNYQVTITAKDSGGSGGPGDALTTRLSFIATVDIPNERPVFDVIGDKVAVSGQPLSFIIQARDPDQNPLTFTADDLPSGMTITPLATYGTARVDWLPTGGDLGTRTLTFHVNDDGNAGVAIVGADTQVIRIVTRLANQAPVLLPVGDQTLSEGVPFTLALATSDADGDPITYSATNLPNGATFDAKLGVLRWTPNFFTAGDYSGIQFTASDGNATSFETITLHVLNVNQAPQIVPMATQSGREAAEMHFTLLGADPDSASVQFTALSPLPSGAIFNRQTGEFKWTPSYDQAGERTIRFGVIDPAGASSDVSVHISIADTDRAPTLAAARYQVLLGQPLSFFLAGGDPDADNTLRYSATGLPLGATLNAVTGEIRWTPDAGQAGDYLIKATVSDGRISVLAPIVLRATTEPELPTVVIEQTPSFAALPGQDVLVHVIATGFADIGSIVVTYQGQALTLDAQGRAHVSAGAPGATDIIARATDTQGYVGVAATTLKVRDPNDFVAPAVSFAPNLEQMRITQATDIIGTVSDTNLEHWSLEIAQTGSDRFTTIATGSGPIANARLALLDPAMLDNGFYTLRLTAADFAGRTGSALTHIEISSQVKAGQLVSPHTDLTATLAGHTISVTRAYDGLAPGAQDTFGNGWRLMVRDVDVVTNVEQTGDEATGVFNPMRVGTRVYVTLPTGERAGFTFAPVEHRVGGLVYYTPSFTSDTGVNWTLQSIEATLARVGDRFYDINTGAAYNPQAYDSSAQYALTAPDGTAYTIAVDSGVTGITFSDGVHLLVADSGIYAPNGDAITFVGGAAGVSRVIGPDGSPLAYQYDADGNLALVRNVIAGTTVRYGYTASGLLDLIADGGAGAFIDRAAGTQAPVTADLGIATGYLARAYSGSVAAGGTDRMTFTVLPSELSSTANGSLYLGIVVNAKSGTATPALPSIEGATLVASNVQGSQAFALYKIGSAGLKLLTVKSATAQGLGAYTLSMFVAGDTNRDGTVDGTDATATFAAIEKASGDPGYNAALDANRDGKVDTTDAVLLFQNLGYRWNVAPVALTATLKTHTDLEMTGSLENLVSDPEGDPTYIRVTGASHGVAKLSNDGLSVTFTPEAGFAGAASFAYLADDGYQTSAPVTVTVNVSGAGLLRFDTTTRAPHVGVGEQIQMQWIGDFEDETGVMLPGSYFTSLTSTDPTSGSIGLNGVLLGAGAGYGTIVAARGHLTSATAFMIGGPGQVSSDDSLLPFYGVTLFPGAVTISTDGGQRQIQLFTNPYDLSTNVAAGSSGVRYYVSDGDIIGVTADGLVYAKAAGQATVTAVYRMVEAQMPVTVRPPVVGATSVDAATGAVVRNADGYQVTVAPGALADNATVTITTRDPDQLDIPPLPVADGWIIGGAFEIDTQDVVVDQPMQIAVPTTLAPGTLVRFYKLADLSNDDNVAQLGWAEVETGIVGADGIARSTSYPEPGVTSEGTYIVAAKQGNNFPNLIPAETIALPVPRGAAILHPPVITNAEVRFAIHGTDTTVEPWLVITGTDFAYRFPKAPKLAGSDLSYLAVVFNPKGTQINGEILGSDAGIIQLQDGSTIVKPASLGQVDTELWVRVPNSLNLALGSSTFKVVRETYIEVQSNKAHPKSRYAKTTKTSAAHHKHWEAVSVYSGEVKITPTTNDIYVAVENGDLPGSAEGFGDQLAVLRPVLQSNGTLLPDLIARIPVGDIGQFQGVTFGSSQTRNPYEIAITPDGSRAYVTMRNGAGVAVVDTLTWQEIDADPTTGNVADTIKFKNAPNAAPFDIVISPDGNYAYVSEQNSSGGHGTIYVIDTDPRSKTFNKHVLTLQVNDAGFGLRGLAMTPDGEQLIASAPSVPAFEGFNESITKNGKVIIIDLPNIAGAIATKKVPVLQQTEFKGGGLQDPEGVRVIAGPDGHLYASFVDATQDFVGVVILSRAADGTWSELNRIALSLGGDTADSFDVNNGVDVVFTQDLGYGFVYARNDFTSFTVKSVNPDLYTADPAGSKIGIIRDPFKIKGGVSGLVAATRNVPLGFGGDVALSADGKYLYGSYSDGYVKPNGSTRGGAVFVFGVQAIINEVESWLQANERPVLGEWAVDDLRFPAPLSNHPGFSNIYGGRGGINTLIDIRADYEIWRGEDDAKVTDNSYGYRPSKPGDPGSFTDGLVTATSNEHAPIDLGGLTRGIAVQRRTVTDLSILDSSGAKDDKVLFFAPATVDAANHVVDASTHVFTVANNGAGDLKVTIVIPANQYLVLLGQWNAKLIIEGFTDEDYVALLTPAAYNDDARHEFPVTIPARSKIQFKFQAVLTPDYIKKLNISDDPLLSAEILVIPAGSAPLVVKTYYLADLVDTNSADGVLSLPDVHEGGTSSIKIRNDNGIAVSVTELAPTGGPSPFSVSEVTDPSATRNAISFTRTTRLPTSRATETAVLHFALNGQEIGTATVAVKETPVQTIGFDLFDLRTQMTDQRLLYKQASDAAPASRENILPGYSRYATFAKTFTLTADSRIPDSQWDPFEAKVKEVIMNIYERYRAIGAIVIDFSTAGTAADKAIITSNPFDPLHPIDPANAEQDFSDADFLAKLTMIDPMDDGKIVLRDDLTAAQMLATLLQLVNPVRENDVNYLLGSEIRDAKLSWTLKEFAQDFGGTYSHETAHNLGLFDEYIELTPKNGQRRTPTIASGPKGIMANLFAKTVSPLEDWFFLAGLDEAGRMQQLVEKNENFGNNVRFIAEQIITLVHNRASNANLQTNPGLLPDKVVPENVISTSFAPPLLDADPFATENFTAAPIVPFGQNGIGLPPASFTLSEDATVGARLTADVVMPADATELRFVIPSLNFFSNGDGPSDAFEFAIVGADGVPLTRITSLTDTDAALNIQADGTVSTSDLVHVSGLDGQGHAGHGPLVVTVGLSGFASGTQIRLYFDLIGFGNAQSNVSINDVQFVEPGAEQGPIATGDRATTAEDSVVTVAAGIGLLSNDISLNESASLVVAAINGSAAAVGTTITLASGALLKVEADGAFSYDPNGRFNSLAAGATALDSFTYTIADAGGLFSSATVTLTITGVNNAPVAHALEAQTDEDTVVGGALTATDAENETLSYALVTPVSGVSLTSNGSWSYDPRGLHDALGPGQTNTVTFSFTASDGHVTSGAALVTITIAGLNDAPLAKAAAAQSDEDTVVGGTLTATDAENDTLSYALVTQVPGVSLQSNGIWRYDPRGLHEALAPGQSDTVTFSFTANDGHATSTAAQVMITITGVNDAPVAKPVEAQTDEDTLISGTLTATDAENDTLSYALVAPVAGVSLQSNGTWSYDPRGRHDALAPGQTDTVSFSFTANDGHLTSTAAQVTITITGLNDPPAISGPARAEVKEGDLVVAVFTTSDVDDGAAVTLELLSGPAGASFDPKTGTFMWRAPDGPMTVSALIRATDAHGGQSQRSFDIVVADVAPQLLVSGDATTVVGAEWTLSLGATDPGDDPVDHWTVDWGDGTVERFSGATSLAKHVFTDAGDFVVRTRLTNDDGEFGPALVNVTARAAALPPLQVIDFEASATGFHVAFNHAFVPGDVSLYGADASGIWADVKFTDASGRPVIGSIVLDHDDKGFSFIKSGGLLRPDAYNVRLVAGAHAFHDTLGALDGDADGQAGGDYRGKFAIHDYVNVIRLPDIVTPPGSALRDAAGHDGLAVTLSNLGGVRQIIFDVDYDPLLVSFDGVRSGAGLPSGATVKFEFVDGAAGRRILRVAIESLTALERGDVELVRLLGHGREIYAGTEIMRISVESINRETAQIVGDDAIHVVANINDTDGDAVAMTARDQALISRFRSNLQSGFEAWSLIDPLLLIADGPAQPTADTPSTPRIIQIPVPVVFFEELQVRLPSLGIKFVQANSGSGATIEIAAPGRHQIFSPGGSPNDFDRPTGSLDANGGSGKIRFCKVTNITFGWTFTVDEMLHALGVDPAIDLHIEPPQTIPSRPAPGGSTLGIPPETPLTSTPGKSGQLEQSLPRFAASGGVISVKPEDKADRASDTGRVVMDGGSAALAFFPAMVAGKRLAPRSSKGEPRRDRKSWRVDFVNGADDGRDPNQEFSVRVSGQTREIFRPPPSL
ncbi:Ig-like domain-containing protein [Bradyrhizobium sp. 143]|uniref:CARDB domain-containing protein n=1 Tax=Bradyrhizobium sp. 143 TaxID=2782619 RepID=UPI003209F469